MEEIELDAEITVENIQAAIKEFINERLKIKLDNLKDGQQEKRERLQADYEPEAWLASAAQRVAKVQQVTHAIKYIHPEARGTNLFSAGNEHVGEYLAGTHSLANKFAADVVADAKNLDVYAFLRVEVGSSNLLELALLGDARLRQALSTNSDKAESWIKSFSSLSEAKGRPASHSLAKQIYWPLGGGKYHLLAPLFPSSLVHSVWMALREHRFSDDARAARDARKNQTWWPHGYHEYPEIVVQKFGGSNPQNISQLNSNRHGEIYLLPSMPPNWQSRKIRPPLFTDTIFQSRFGRRRRVRDAVDELKRYLHRVAGINNLPVRQGRARRVQLIFDELLQYAAEIWQLEPGWSADSDCRLNIEEQCWLDPDRALLDEVFASVREQGDWRDAICQRFANWLNARLTDGRGGLPVGENEAQEWHRLLDRELSELYRELS